MQTVMSDNGLFKAVVEPVDDGTYVEIWRLRRGDGNHVWHRMTRATVNGPFHFVRDWAADLVNELRTDHP